MSGRIAGIMMWLLATLAASAQAQTVVEYLHTDALGSVVAVTNASRTVLERREYEPYGSQLTPVVSNGPGYTGHVQDAATGLVYMQQRYYDAQIGVFLSVDPVTAHESPIDQFHRYRYANNNPYKFTDPDGRSGKLVRVGVKLIKSGGDLKKTGKETFVEIADSISTLVDPDASLVEKALAVVDLVSPVSSKEVKAGAQAVAEKTSRAGKPFTRAGKREVIQQNQNANGGKTVCQGCNATTVPATKSERGISPAPNETRVDHVDPMSKGGSGDPSNGQVLCNSCNLDKSNDTDWVPPKNRELK